jgi:hypothetical protein
MYDFAFYTLSGKEDRESLELASSNTFAEMASAKNGIQIKDKIVKVHWWVPNCSSVLNICAL